MVSATDLHWLQKTVDLARQAEGFVEPNPMVGALVVKTSPPASLADGATPIATGWHRQFGGAHAEVEALGPLSPGQLRGATLYVSLEPCCHFGKTPPCTELLIAKQVERIVVGCLDPNPLVAGNGIAALMAAGVKVEVAENFQPAIELIRPFGQLLKSGRPWFIAKWAMSMDGKIATANGDSQWISGNESRAEVHRWRGQVDAILTGIGTAIADNPLLTARPPGPRSALRIVCDSRCRLSPDSRLVQTAREIPVLLMTGPEHDRIHRQRLEAEGVEVGLFQGSTPAEQLLALAEELGRRKMTNVLIEAGGGLNGGLMEAGLVDEIRCFVAPILVGGSRAPSPVAGTGVPNLAMGHRFVYRQIRQIGDDILLVGRKALNQNGQSSQAKG